MQLTVTTQQAVIQLTNKQLDVNEKCVGENSVD